MLEMRHFNTFHTTAIKWNEIIVIFVHKVYASTSDDDGDGDDDHFISIIIDFHVWNTLQWGAQIVIMGPIICPLALAKIDRY